MRILVVHGWVTRNLGDVLQTSVLLDALRGLRPSGLDMAAFFLRPTESWNPILATLDRFVPERPLPPSGRLELLRRPVWALAWKRERRALFRAYDLIVSAPGPFVADYDARLRSTLLDLDIARDLGVPFVFSSHSMGPLGPKALGRLALAAEIVAREPMTHAYLRANGVASRLSADLSFLFPHSSGRLAAAYRERFGPGYRVAFLRFNNLDLGRIELRGDGALGYGDSTLLGPGSGSIVLATSEPADDGVVLAALAARRRLDLVACATVEELFALVEGASAVASDRYHPCVCAALLGKKLEVIENREPMKMAGLKALLARHSVSEIRDLARSGLEAVLEVARAVAR